MTDRSSPALFWLRGPEGPGTFPLHSLHRLLLRSVGEGQSTGLMPALL